MSAAVPEYDMQEQLARIRRAQEESDKFNSEQRKLSAEMFKLNIETLKRNADAAKLNGDRLLVLIASIAGGAIAAGIGLLAGVH